MSPRTSHTQPNQPAHPSAALGQQIGWNGKKEHTFSQQSYRDPAAAPQKTLLYSGINSQPTSIPTSKAEARDLSTKGISGGFVLSNRNARPRLQDGAPEFTHIPGLQRQAPQMSLSRLSGLRQLLWLGLHSTLNTLGLLSAQCYQRAQRGSSCKVFPVSLGFYPKPKVLAALSCPCRLQSWWWGSSLARRARHVLKHAITHRSYYVSKDLLLESQQ